MITLTLIPLGEDQGSHVVTPNEMVDMLTRSAASVSAAGSVTPTYLMSAWS